MERSTQYTSFSSKKQPANAGSERKQFTENASVVPLWHFNRPYWRMRIQNALLLRLGVLSWEKLKIVSLDQLGSRRTMQFLIFWSCLSPGRVKKLQKFMNFCLKVGHSANLKHSKSTWRQLIVLSCEMYKIITSKALGNRGTGTIYNSASCRFAGAFVRSRSTNYEFVYTLSYCL